MLTASETWGSQGIVPENSGHLGIWHCVVGWVVLDILKGLYCLYLQECRG